MSFRHKLKPKSAADAIEEEARKLKENEETALVLQQFIETFEEPTNVNKTWVKGGVVTPGSSIQSLEGAGRMYQPYLRTIEKATEKLKDKLLPEVEKSPLTLNSKKDQKKKSNLEAFSEELKQMQQEREMRLMKRKSIVDKVEDLTVKFSTEVDSKPVEEVRKSRFDSTIVPVIKTTPLLTPYPYDLDFPYENENDRTSTNLFLGNLNPELTEQQLCELFGRFGPLASVKIMWPRSDEEKARGRNCGFVAFMNRTDGERALDKLRGEEICGYEMKLGWGKTVLIPPYPVYVPPALQERIKAPPCSGLPFNAQPRDWIDKQEKALPFDRIPYDMSSMTDEELSEILKICVVKVVIPVDRSLVLLINRMVEFVVREGVEFEAFIMNKEMRNPHFKFLFDFQSPEHVYYRWKLYSILHGENTKSWKTHEFQMYVDGPMWRPPPHNPYTAGMPEELIVDFDVTKLTLENIRSLDMAGALGSGHDQNKDGVTAASATVANMPVPPSLCMENPYNHNNIYKRLLTDSQRERLIEMLGDLEPSRVCIGETMVWCLEHADSAEEVVSVLVRQLERTISDSIESGGSSHLNRIVAHIFLISDILHNSCAKVRNASYYRKFIENVLSSVMADYNRYYQSISSKVKSEQLKHKVLSCFRAWGDWYVYPYDFLLKLQNQFLGIVEPTPTIVEEKPTTDSTEDNMLDRKPLVDYDGDPLDVDGVPLESSNNVSSLSSTTKTGAVQAQNNNHEMIDMFANPNSPPTKNSDTAAMFVTSKWETVDPAEEESEMVQSRWHILEAQMDERKSDNDDPDGFPLSDNDGYDLSKIVVPVDDRHNGDSSQNKTMSSLVSYGKGSSDEDDDDDGGDGVEDERTRKREEEEEDRRRNGRSGGRSRKDDRRTETQSSSSSRRQTMAADSSEDEEHSIRRTKMSPRRARRSRDRDGVPEDGGHHRSSHHKTESVIEVKSKVIRLDHRSEEPDSSSLGGSRRSRRSPKVSDSTGSKRGRADHDKRQSYAEPSSKRRRGSRTRSRSPVTPMPQTSSSGSKRSSHRRRSRDKRH